MGANSWWFYHFGGLPYFECLDQWKKHQKIHRGTDKGGVKCLSRELMEKESKASRELIEKLVTKLSDQHANMTKILTEMARSAK